MMPSTTAMSVKVTLSEKKRLSLVAKRTKRSAHYVMREALLEHLKRMESRLEFLREAEEAYEDYKKTGEYYATADVDQWIASGMKEWPKPRKHG